MVASGAGNANIVTYLLDEGASVNAKDDKGMTPLLHAVRYHESPDTIVKVLLANGADTEIADKAGKNYQTYLEDRDDLPDSVVDKLGVR